MMWRVLAVVGNTYREAVRARVLHALFALALSVTGYSLVLGTLSLTQDARVIADVGSASASLFGLVLAVTLAATTLHREVELKTLYPMLTRRLLRHEYLLGKFAGMFTTLGAFLVTNAGLTLTLLTVRAGETPWLAALPLALWLASFGAMALRRQSRTYALLPAALVCLLSAAWVCGPQDGERQLVLWQLWLSIAESAVVLAMTLLLASFSSPFLTAAGAAGLVVMGRSADTLANLPSAMFGDALATLGRVVARVVPNLQLFVPERPLLLGRAAVATWPYMARSSGLACAYCVVLLGLASFFFSRRDFE